MYVDIFILGLCWYVLWEYRTDDLAEITGEGSRELGTKAGEEVAWGD